MSAGARRELAVEAAMAEFAHGGYDGTSTWTIARRVGVSQPYMFRLFPTKHALFLAAAERCFDGIEDVLRAAAAGLHGEDAMAAMAEAYGRLPLDEPDLLRMQLKVHAIAVRDEEVGRLGRIRWARLWRVVSELSGEEPGEIAGFLSAGLLLNVVTAFGVPHATGDDLPRSIADWAEGLRGVETLSDHPDPL
ncbi:TetR/AcrR family transcriptional regulator [Actinomadura sp. 7K507]|nr:TetR/AcrR family transcriptional regulator [Actinomadura sp. 7K507]